MPVWLTVLLGLIGFVGFIGSSLVYLRGSKDKGTIDVLERSNKALTERVAILEEEAARCGVRLGVLERENADLRAQRPSAEAIEEMHGLLIQHIDELRHHDTETRPLLMAMAASLGELTDGH